MKKIAMAVLTLGVLFMAGQAQAQGACSWQSPGVFGDAGTCQANCNTLCDNTYNDPFGDKHYWGNWRCTTEGSNVACYCRVCN